MAPDWTKLTLRLQNLTHLPTENEIELSGIWIQLTGIWDGANQYWDNLEMACDGAWDAMTQEQIIVDAFVAYAVASNPRLLDAAVRSGKTQGCGLKSECNHRIGGCGPTCSGLRINWTTWAGKNRQRPQLSYEVGEALRNARKKLSKERQVVNAAEQKLEADYYAISIGAKWWNIMAAEWWNSQVKALDRRRR